MDVAKKGIDILEANDSSAHILLSKELYEKEAVFAALYLFEDKCVMVMTPEGATQFRVAFSLKDQAKVTANMLNSLIGQFCNELIDQQVRRDLERQFGDMRSLIVEHAFSPIKNLESRIS